MRLADLATLKLAIWGLGREGHATQLALRKAHPDLPLSIFCSEAEAVFMASDAGHDRYITHAPNAAELSAFDLVIKSPGISAYRPELLEAQHNGTRFTSATALWFAEQAPRNVITVTGTKGKSTTSALVAHLLRALGLRTALAGNIGLPVLELLHAPELPDWWVLELSSFQTRQAAAVDLAVITNIEEEHLDWHGNRERYVEDKLALADVASQLLVNGNHAELLRRTATHPRRRVFGTPEGWHVAGGFLRRGDQAVLSVQELPFAGSHNALNACAALAALECIGVDAMAAVPALARFRPLPHRLQWLGERDGRSWVDDSIATTPQASIEALRSLGGRPACLILGGHERGLDWHPFADFVKAHPPVALVCNGASGARIAAVLRACAAELAVHEVADLAAAVGLARSLTPAGGVVLLSPGAPSFDQFHDYAERGRAFAELAGFDAEAIGQIEGLGIA